MPHYFTAFLTPDYLVENASNVVAAKIHSDSLVIPFDFPEEIRTASEQYLLYFAQFLKDIGINATTDVHHEAHQVFFSVTPAEGQEALQDKDALHCIRQLLDIYLNLPSAGETSTSVMLSRDIEVQRMAANIQHLNGQIMLGQALIQTQIAQLQAKDAAIEAKEATISLLRQGNVLAQSMVTQPANTSKDGEDFADVVGAIFKIKPVDMKIGELDLDALFKVLRKMFKRQKDGDSSAQ